MFSTVSKLLSFKWQPPKKCDFQLNLKKGFFFDPCISNGRHAKCAGYSFQFSVIRTFSALIDLHLDLHSDREKKRFGDTMYRTLLWPSNKQNGSLLKHNSLLMGGTSICSGGCRTALPSGKRTHPSSWLKTRRYPCRSKRNHGKARKEKES
jgi:hypothetical protein